ncbi:uncharacterized protein BDZ99DRAFT_470436 [Mytilinidion resinicola]|uniref:Zn(2)-C6 fungal-type domain-containing protein n=1 Tax=Mytilinidion resinicola TaxID=574789 RepID=A0A6A6ZB35_9PEZI|nr:uncharacterized protein BDZ99DRAFT_470436 [Mytilinidion resinicola]KAF2817427.1 hypothetical protein BDZ99DRAFT_470436 [Mytilinidion resinicola]
MRHHGDASVLVFATPSQQALNKAPIAASRVRVRVRTGCFTCKTRRVKCDETKPHCLRCTQTGRKCDGYPRDQRPSLLTTSFYSLPFRIPGSQHDRQIFHYYYIHAARDLCGFSTGSSSFWRQLVFELAFQLPVVREALIALASIHRDYATFSPASNVAEGPSSITLTQHNKALRRFRIYLSQSPDPKKEAVIVCCILFHCFESVRGEYEWAVKHLDTGLRLLESWHPGSLSGPAPLIQALNFHENLDTLRTTLIRLDMQLSVFKDDRIPSFALVSKDVTSGQSDCTPSHFHSPAQAQQTLETLQNWLLHFLISYAQYKFLPPGAMPYSVSRELHALRTQFARWDTAIQELTPRAPSNATEFRDVGLAKTISFMKLTYNICVAVLSFSYPQPAEEPAVDMQLRTLLSEIELLLLFQSSSSGDGDNSLPRSVSCDTGIVMPLFLLAVKCRDAPLRHRALTTLSTLSRQEGLMNAKMMLGIVVNAMRLEIAGSKFPTEGETPAVEEWAGSLIDVAGDYHALAVLLGV